MRAVSFSLVILIVVVQLNRQGASMSTSTEKSTTTSQDGIEISEIGKLFDQLGGKEVNNITDLPKPTNKSQDHPLFVVAPGLISVPDDLPVSSELGKVEAADPTNQGRKCVYHLTNSSIPDLFSVDTNTGVITTNMRLDIVENASLTIQNITECKILISTTFQNFTDDFDREFIEVTVKLLHGSLRDLRRGIQNGTISTVEKSSSDGGNNWIQLSMLAGIAIIIVMVLVILITVVAMGIDKWKKSPLASPPHSFRLHRNHRPRGDSMRQ